MLEVAKRSGKAVLFFASEKLQKDEEVIFEAVKQDREAIKYIDKTLKSDLSFMKKIRQLDEEPKSSCTPFATAIRNAIDRFNGPRR